ncbi:Gfo/Idh/MocA family protein [Syntrophobacter fumaroxidans]|uniref:Oxidoreductase domain protein n=1 Tax=Syntrophobacter fumaroxidans (strain DSM 10017 / MPOB) TaxID=335543 RepID=A0LME7_SYNFM|nr:Gfo/Idh/MocA family oxidoreductase [Syntrophobacter fumaroxidans]ABK18599.1 oxidoreductase domain protein [Syntrophobacter fumaroxidans MPOB]
MNESVCGVRTPLRGAIIGLGNVAVHAHLPVWLRNGNFNIEAFVEPSSERIEVGRTLLPGARAYPTMDALLADGGVDFVDICTPPCYHAELALAACSAGMHVFCEKPLTISPERLDDIQKAAERTQRVVFTVNNWKYAPIWVKLCELIEHGRIGTVRSVALEVLRLPNSGGGLSDWRKCAEVAQGGILIDHGWHNLYLIFSLLKEFPLSMEVSMKSPAESGSGLEETVDLTMRFREAEARLHLTWQASCRRNHGVVVGERGKILVNDDHLVLHSAESPPVRFDFPEALSNGSHHAAWMGPVVENFGHEIMEHRHRGTNLTEARWCARLIDLAYRSSRDASGFTTVCNVPPDIRTQ